MTDKTNKIDFFKKLIKTALNKSIVNENYANPEPSPQPQQAAPQQAETMDSKPIQVATFLSPDQRIIEAIKSKLGGKFKTQNRRLEGNNIALDVFMISVGDLRPFVASLNPLTCKLQVRTDESVYNIRLHGNDNFQSSLTSQQPQSTNQSSQGKTNTIFQ